MVRIPDAGDFAQGPSARDPGLTVPASPFGRGLENIGRQIGALAERRQAQDVEQERAAQAFRQKQQEAEAEAARKEEEFKAKRQKAEDLRYTYEYRAALRNRTADVLTGFSGREAEPTYADELAKATQAAREAVDQEFSSRYAPSEEARLGVQSFASDLLTSQRIGALADGQRAALASAVAAITLDADGRDRTVYEAASPDVAEGAIEETRAAAANMAGAMSEAKLIEWTAQRNEKTAESYYLGVLEQGGTEAVEKALDAKQFTDYMSPAAMARLREGIENERARERQRAEAAYERLLRDADKELAGMQTLAAGGYIPDSTTLERMTAQMAPEDAKSYKAQIGVYKQVGRDVQGMGLLTPSQREAVINEVYLNVRTAPGGVTPEAVEYANALTATLKEQTRQEEHDATVLAIANGSAPAAPAGADPLLSDTRYRIWSLNAADAVARGAGAEIVYKQVFPRPVFDQLTSALTGDDVNAMSDAMTYLSEASPAARASASQFMGDKIGPSTRTAIALAATPQGVDTAVEIMRGRRLLAQPGQKSFAMPDARAVEAVTREMLGASFKDAPGAREDIVQAAYAVYAMRAGATDTSGSGMTKQLFQQALRDVMPLGIGTHHGVKIRVSKDYDGETGFAAKLRSLSGAVSTLDSGAAFVEGMPQAASRQTVPPSQVFRQVVVLPNDLADWTLSRVVDGNGNEVDVDDIAEAGWASTTTENVFIPVDDAGGHFYMVLTEPGGFVEYSPPPPFTLSVDRLMKAVPTPPKTLPRGVVEPRETIPVDEPRVSSGVSKMESRLPFAERNRLRMEQMRQRAQEIDQNLRRVVGNE